MHFIHSYIKNESVWDRTAHFKHCWVRVCILEGPEDDSTRIEIFCPNTILNIIKFFCVWLIYHCRFIQCVALATEPGISLIILPLMRLLGALQTHTTNTFLFISHTTNVLLLKFGYNINVVLEKDGEDQLDRSSEKWRSVT